MELSEVMSILGDAVKHTSYSYAPNPYLSNRLHDSLNYLRENLEVMEHRATCGDSCPCYSAGLEAGQEAGVSQWEGRREV